MHKVYLPACTGADHHTLASLKLLFAAQLTFCPVLLTLQVLNQNSPVHSLTNAAILLLDNQSCAHVPACHCCRPHSIQTLHGLLAPNAALLTLWPQLDGCVSSLHKCDVDDSALITAALKHHRVACSSANHTTWTDAAAASSASDRSRTWNGKICTTWLAAWLPR